MVDNFMNEPEVVETEETWQDKVKEKFDDAKHFVEVQKEPLACALGVLLVGFAGGKLSGRRKIRRMQNNIANDLGQSWSDGYRTCVREIGADRPDEKQKK